MNETEYHVASFVVRSRPEDESSVAEQITQLPGLEVHVCESGKLIVTAEAENTRRLAELTGALEIIEKVIQVSPVYHEFTQGDDLENSPQGSKNTRSQVQ